jgi:NAD(P)-dependent dehydrogenase (short-subunit alcohol dehydrogenase family)
MGNTDFAGRTALITGGTSGVGRDTALLLARIGARVVITGRDVERGNQVVKEIIAGGGQGEFVRADLTNDADVRELADQIGPVDMLVNNAGYAEFAPTAQITEAGFDAMFAVNVKGPFFLTAAFAPAMAARGHGAIVNVSTMVAVRGAAGAAAYGASKAALESLTRSWAAEFGPAGVRVNAVTLGPTRTPGSAATADMNKALAEASPLRRENEPSDVAEAIRYLLSDTAIAITGAVLPVDGGRLAAL